MLCFCAQASLVGRLVAKLATPAASLLPLTPEPDSPTPQGLKKHPLYLINGLTIVGAWTVARIATFPPFFWVVYKTRDTINTMNILSQFLRESWRHGNSNQGGDGACASPLSGHGPCLTALPCSWSARFPRQCWCSRPSSRC